MVSALARTVCGWVGVTWYPAEVVTGPSSTVTVSTSYAGARLGV